MTGSDEKPPGKVAENWSRRDRIRAGSVSGPWRSAARTEEGSRPIPPPSSQQRSAPPATDRPLPLEWMGRGGPAPNTAPAAPPSIGNPTTEAAVETALGETIPPQPSPMPEPPEPAPVLTDGDVSREPEQDAAAAAAPPRSPEPARIRPMPRSNLLPVVSAASLLAIAIVVAAVLLRPDAPGPRVAGAGSEPVVAARADLPTMRLRVGPAFPPERQTEILDVLADAGHVDVLVERIPFSIAVSRVGYYRPEDRAAASDLARLVSPVLDEPTGTIAVRDYAELIPDAAPGRLDLWVGSLE